MHAKQAARKPFAPRPVTATYLRNAAMHYVSGRAASAAMVRATLERRSKRRLAVRSLEGATLELIESVVGELMALGLIDDARFAEGRTATLERKGLPRGRIVQGLRAKGVPEQTIEQTVGAGPDALTQARRFVERKRLGRLRRGGMTPESRQKDLAALARAGFAFAIAARALDHVDEP